MKIHIRWAKKIIGFQGNARGCKIFFSSFFFIKLTVEDLYKVFRYNLFDINGDIGSTISKVQLYFHLHSTLISTNECSHCLSLQKYVAMLLSNLRNLIEAYHFVTSGQNLKSKVGIKR